MTGARNEGTGGDGTAATELRDARLRRALEAAPDVHMRPDAATRAAILQVAAAAVAPTPPVEDSFWRKLWPAKGSHSMPWNAVLATVLLATLVTLIWRNEEIPGAAPDRADRPIPPAAPAAAPAPLHVPATAQAKTESAKAAAIAAAQAPMAPADGGRVGSATAPKAVVPPDGKAAQSEAESRKEDSAPAPEKPAAAGQHGVRGMSAEPAAPVAAPPAPAAVAAPTAVPRRSEAAEAPSWSQLRIVWGIKAVRVERAQAGPLASLIGRALASPAVGAPFTDAAPVRVELLHDGEPAGTLAIGETLLRWVPAGGAAVVLRPNAVLLQTLAAELARFAP